MVECRLQMIRDGKELIPRSCQRCGLFNRCQEFLDEPSPPKPMAESRVEALTTEIDRLKAELELRTRIVNGLSEFVTLRERSDGFELEDGIVHFTYVTEGEYKHTWKRNGETINNPELYDHLIGMRA